MSMATTCEDIEKALAWANHEYGRQVQMICDLAQTWDDMTLPQRRAFTTTLRGAFATEPILKGMLLCALELEQEPEWM
jgi:hypothetical protein